MSEKNQMIKNYITQVASKVNEQYQGLIDEDKINKATGMFTDSNEEYDVIVQRINELVNQVIQNYLKEQEKRFDPKLVKENHEEIYSKYKGYPYIMFTRTIAEYNYCIHKLYAEFFDNIEQVFNDTLLEVERLLKQRPELIYNSKNSLNGNILIKDNSSHIHCFRYSKMKTRKMFYDFKEKAQFYLDEEKTEFELLNKSIIFN